MFRLNMCGSSKEKNCPQQTQCFVLVSCKDLHWKVKPPEAEALPAGAWRPGQGSA